MRQSCSFQWSILVNFNRVFPKDTSITEKSLDSQPYSKSTIYPSNLLYLFLNPPPPKAMVLHCMCSLVPTIE